MGQYYVWANPKRKEYISPNDFDYGNKLIESMGWKDNTFLSALQELLVNEWKDDKIIFLGDYCNINRDNSAKQPLKLLYEQTIQNNSKGYDVVGTVVLETYRNLSGQFRTCIQEEVKSEIDYYLEDLRKGDQSFLSNEYGVDIKDPYKGLFQREGKDFAFIINHSKKIGYARNDIKIILENGKIWKNCDPLPLLMECSGGYEDEFYIQKGDWVGDVIAVTDTFPEDYTLLNQIEVDY